MKKTLLFLLILFAFSCSSSENPPEIEDSTDDTTVINPPNNPGQSEETFPDFTVIGFIEDESSRGEYYQYDFNSDNRTGVLSNLTQELNLIPFLSGGEMIKVSGTNITFFDRSRVQGTQSKDFTIWHKNIGNNSFFRKEGFFDYSNESEWPLVFVMRNDTGLFVWQDLSPENIGPDGEYNLMLRILDESNEIEDFLIKRTRSSGSNFKNPLVIENFLFIPHRTDESEILVVDLDKKELVDEIKEINGVYILKDETNNLIIVGENKVFTYNPFTQSISSVEANQIVGESQESDNQDIISNNRIFYRLPAAQPSPFPFLPAVYYVDTMESFIVPIYDKQVKLEEDEFAWRPFPLSAVFDVNSDYYLMGVRKDNTYQQYGMILVNLEGEILDAITIPLAPYRILVN